MKVTLPPLPAAPLTGRGKRDTDGRIDRSQITALRSRWPTPRPPITARSPPEVYVMSRLGAGLAAAFGAVRRRAGWPRAGQSHAGQLPPGEPRTGEPPAGERRAESPRAGQEFAGSPRAGREFAGSPRAERESAGSLPAGTPRAGRPVLRRGVVVSAVAVLAGASLAAAAASAATAAAGRAAAPPGALAAASSVCQVTYTVNSDWGTGFSIAINITNNGPAITSWTLGYAYAGNQKIAQGWSGNWSQSGENITVTNASWNGSLATGGSTQIGANFSYTGTNTAPTVFTLNGGTCIGSPTPLPTPPPPPPPTSPSPSPS